MLTLFCKVTTWNKFLKLVCFPWAAAAAAKLLQSSPTLCHPIDGSPPGSPSLGLSRQEHWSGLPFPSPMHESEKGKWSLSVVSDSSRPHGLQPARLLCPWDFPGKNTGVGCHCLEQYWSNIHSFKSNCLLKCILHPVPGCVGISKINEVLSLPFKILQFFILDTPKQTPWSN